jgi:hypothetical protein
MGLISLWLYKENNKLRDWKNAFTLHIPLWPPHTYDFVVLTSLTHRRKILLVVLQIGKAKDLSAGLPVEIPSIVTLLYVTTCVGSDINWAQGELHHYSYTGDIAVRVWCVYTWDNLFICLWRCFLRHVCDYVQTERCVSTVWAARRPTDISGIFARGIYFGVYSSRGMHNCTTWSDEDRSLRFGHRAIKGGPKHFAARRWTSWCSLLGYTWVTQAI